MKENQLPMNIEAEQSVLGAMIISQKALEYGALKLSAKVFHLDSHKKIFEVLAELCNEKVAIDITTLTERLKTKRFLNQTGGVEYILEIINSVPTASNIKYYADIVLEKAARRSIIAVANNVIQKTLTDENTAKDLLINFNKKINEFIKSGNFTEEDRMKTISEIDLTYTEQTFIKSNITSLDKITNGFALGELTIWSGSNASGKSSILGQMAIESIDQGQNVAMFSGELTDKRLLNWLMMQCAGKSHISKNEQKNTYFVNSNVKEKILNWLDNKLYVYDNNYGNKAEEVLQSVRDCIDKHNIKLVILDNLMSMNLSSYGEQKYEEQTKLVTELSALAKEKNVHIHFVCHPRKSLSFLRKNDISGTADITNIADNVIIIHRVNVDFKNKTKEMFNWSIDNEIYQFANVVEICKNREYGIEDEFIGLYFEIESKRFLNYPKESKYYGWTK